MLEKAEEFRSKHRGYAESVRVQLKDVVRQYPLEALVREDLAGYSFHFLIVLFEQIHALLVDLVAADLYRLSESDLSQINDELNVVAGVLGRVSLFRPQKAIGSNPNEEHNRLAQDVREVHVRASNCFRSHLAFLGRSRSFERKQIEQLLNQIGPENTDENLINRLQALEVRANAILTAMQTAAEKTGAARHAKLFGSEAESHERQATSWLCVTGFGFFILVITLLFFYMDAKELAGLKRTTVIDEFGVIRLAVISLLLTASIWTAKIYRAHRHNATVNRHRHNALATFELFVDSTNDEQTKNAVLLEATRCIFGPQNTGYSSGDSDPAPTTQVIEVIRGIGQGKV